MSTLEQLQQERELWTLDGFRKKFPKDADLIDDDTVGVWYYVEAGYFIERIDDGKACVFWQHDEFIGTIDEAEAWLAAQIDAEFPPGEVA